MHLKFHTNISFGGEGQPIDYTQDSKQADPTRHIHEYTGVLNKEVEKFIKQSSLYFGNDPRVQERGPRGHGIQGQRHRVRKIQATTAKLKKDQGVPLLLGEDKIEYTTDYQRGYQPYLGATGERRGSLAKEVKADLQYHFGLGHGPVLWEVVIEWGRCNGGGCLLLRPRYRRTTRRTS